MLSFASIAIEFHSMTTQRHIHWRQQLSLRVAYQLLAVVLLALGLNAYLNYSNFDKTQRQLAESRVLVSSGDVKRAISGAMDLGLGLGEIANLRQIVEAGLESGKASEISEISVLGLGGGLLVSTSGAPGDWSGVGHWPVEKQQKEILRSLATDRFAIGLPLVNSFSVQTGWLIVAYDGQSQLIARERMRIVVLRDFGIAALLASVVVLVGVLLLTRRFSQGLLEVIDAQSSLRATSPEANQEFIQSKDEVDALGKACGKFRVQADVMEAFPGKSQPLENQGRTQ
jgi:hypothetical protein